MSATALAEKKIKIVYRPRDGSGLSREKAQIVGPELKRISLENNGITAPLVVESARSSSSPLHFYFEWDDERAAELYRHKEAGRLIRSVIEVKFIKHGGDWKEESKINSFHLVTVKEEEDDAPKRKYLEVGRIRESKDLIDQVMEQAEKELRIFQAKYSAYQKELKFVRKFGKLLNAIDQAIGAAQ